MDVAKKKRALSAAYRSCCCMRNRSDDVKRLHVRDSSRRTIRGIVSVSARPFRQNDPASFRRWTITFVRLLINDGSNDRDSCRAAANAESRVDARAINALFVQRTRLKASDRSEYAAGFEAGGDFRACFFVQPDCTRNEWRRDSVIPKVPGAARCAATFART